MKTVLIIKIIVITAALLLPLSSVGGSMPAGNSYTNALAYPAAYNQYIDNVIAVGATDINDNKPDFSNYGTWVDVSGGHISQRESCHTLSFASAC